MRRGVTVKRQMTLTFTSQIAPNLRKAAKLPFVWGAANGGKEPNVSLFCDAANVGTSEAESNGDKIQFHITTGLRS